MRNCVILNTAALFNYHTNLGTNLMICLFNDLNLQVILMVSCLIIVRCLRCLKDTGYECRLLFDLMKVKLEMKQNNL